MRIRKLYVAMAAGAATIAAGTGIGFAVWTVGGSGSGAGGATVANNLTVTAATPSGAAASLYPGGPAGPVFIEVANANPFPVTITQITFGTPISTNTTACANTNISLDPGVASGITPNLSIPANATAGTAYQLNGVLDLAHSAPNGCQGVTFDVPVTVQANQQ